MDTYLSITGASGELDLVIFVDPTQRIQSGEFNLPEVYDEQYARMTLAHELAHTAMRNAYKDRVELDEGYEIRAVTPLDGSFGRYVPEEDRPEDYWLGSMWDEGQAVLLASRLYNAVEGEDEILWNFHDHNSLVPKELVCRVDGAPEGYDNLVDNNAPAAQVILHYDTSYPGVVDDIFRLARCEITQQEFADNMNTREAGLHERLLYAVYESDWLKVVQGLSHDIR